MSQQAPQQTAELVTDSAAARAVVDHHAQLSAALTERVEALVHLVDTYQLLKAEAARQELVRYLRTEVVPHAQAEEEALYPPAAQLPEGRLLLRGMIEEHRALIALAAELADSNSLVRAAAAARGISALFAVHLSKENTLVLPLLLGTAGVRLAQILAGMHEILGAAEHAESAGECGCGGCECGRV